MTNLKLQFQQLIHFVKAADLGSISAAAEMLHISQPTVSVSINKLEGELGVKLLYRSYSGIHLTPAGASFLANARTILAQIDSAVANVENFREAKTDKRKRKIRLGLMPQHAQVLLTPLVEQCVRRYPDIDLVIREGSGKSIISLLEEGEIDFAISNVDGTSRIIAAERIVAQEFYLIGSSKTAEDQSKPIHLRDLHEYQLIQGATDGSSERRRALQQLAGERNITLDFEFNSPVSIRNQLMQTLGCSSVSLYFIFAKEIAEGELWARPIRRPTLIQFLYLMRRQSSVTRPSKKIIYGLIKSQVRQLIRQGSLRWYDPDKWGKRGTLELDAIQVAN